MLGVLFGDFPREVGIPARSGVNSFEALEKFIGKNNGKNDCFVSVYADSCVVDKLFFDIDSPHGFLRSRSAATRVYNYLITNGFTAVTILSGKKGFHIYAPLIQEPSLTKSMLKRLLRDASVYIIEKTLSEEERTFMDFAVIGDIRRIARIPNTLRPPKNVMHCVVLPSNWTDLSDVELVRLAKNPNFISLDWEPHHKLSELPLAKKHSYNKLATESVKVHYVSHAPHEKLHNGAIDRILNQSLRPCLKHFVTSANPPHYARYAATLDLLNLKYTEDNVFEIFSQLNWIDFNSAVTKYQIHTAQVGLDLGAQSSVKRDTLRINGICMDTNFTGSCKNCKLEEAVPQQ
jgi:hypothetical protein